MLIRSQDKKSLINTNTISQLYVDDDNTITADFNNSDDDGFEIIGEYSTEAKAIKVLDMICDAYELCERTDYQNIGYVGNGVFYMPSDEESEE